jgi:hypothetical protein
VPNQLRSLARVVALASVTCALACGEPPHPVSPPATTSASAPPSSATEQPTASAPSASAPEQAPPSATELAMRDRLDSEGVYQDRLTRRVLYTWTTPAQVEELRKTRTLLSRSESTKGRSRYDADLDKRTDAVARILRDPALAKKRFAWTNPWATSRGVFDETYGSELVRITLRGGAVIAVFDARESGPVRVIDTNTNAETSAESVVSNPSRIAVVYHVSSATKPSSSDAYPFREFVLMNESMIERWEIATKPLVSDLAADLEMLHTIRAAITREKPTARDAKEWGSTVSTTLWPKYPGPAQELPPVVRLSQRYDAALAFLTDSYALEIASLDAQISALSKAMAATQSREPIEVAEYKAFPTLSPASTAPPPKPRNDCFAGSLAVPCRLRR